MIESRAQMQERKGYTLQDVIVPEKAFPQTREVHKASKTPPSKSLASKAFLLPPSIIVTSENGWPGAPNPTAQPFHPINFEWSLNHLKWKLCPGKNNFKLSLTLSLPEYLMEVCKVPLTFESADEILWWDHSNETSLPVLSHGTICFSKFEKMKFGNLVEICLWLHLAVKGLRSLFMVLHPFKNNQETTIFTLRILRAL